MFGPLISPAKSRSNIFDNIARPEPAIGATLPGEGRGRKATLARVARGRRTMRPCK